LLRDYAKTHGFSIVREYVDDGYSGTNYNRPAFEQMRKDIEAGQINLVITKDLSRLGRNYIASGELTEVYFPMHRVRLIAVNDGYDSQDGEDDMAPFRHVMNELYARDISRKIRTALRAKVQNGQYIGSFAPYGYQKSPANKNLLIPDETAAPIVRRIFREAAEGIPTRRIAQALTAERIPIPLDHRNLRQGKPSEGRPWTPSGICKLLRNPVYLGHTVQGKSEKYSFRAGASHTVPKEQWIIVKNTHESLIKEDIFFFVNRKSMSKNIKL